MLAPINYELDPTGMELIQQLLGRNQQAPGQPQLPGQGQSLGGAQGFQFGANIPTFQAGLSGLATLGNLWGSFQNVRLGRDQLRFAKQFAERNLANQTQSYNTALEDRTRSRTSNPNSQQVEEYLNRHRLG